MIYKTKDLKIYKSYWYVLDFTVFHKPTILPIYFISSKLARQAIVKQVEKGRRKFFKAVQGDKLITYNFPVIFKKGTWGKVTKYEYPTDRYTRQQRKTYRTVLRRRLRRMGLLSFPNTKKKITDKPGTVKPIYNKQKVANNKNSEARVFQLHRKPDHIYYYQLAKPRLSGTAKKLFIIDVIRIDMKNFHLKYLELETWRNDIIKPYTLTEFETIIHETRQASEEAKEVLIARLLKRFVPLI